MWAESLPLTASWPWRDVVALGKPRLSGLVLCTTGVGMWLAPTKLPWPRALLLLLATGLVVAAANALNSYLERDTDARMRRTRGRPLAARRLEPRLALALALGGGALAITTLYWAANPAAALLAFIAYASYAFVYTPMKRHSAWALLVGAVPGAIPPLLGWTAATGRLSIPGWSLFALMFAWQLPHFLAIATYLRDDYARGGLKVLPQQCAPGPLVAVTVLATIAQAAASVMPWAAGLAGPGYLVGAGVMGAAFVVAALSGAWRVHLGRWGRQLFVGSVAYLTALLGLLVAGV